MSDYSYDRQVEAKEFATEESLKRYLRKHPKSDPKNHSVRGPSKGGPSKGGSPAEQLSRLSPADQKKVIEDALRAEKKDLKVKIDRNNRKPSDPFKALDNLSDADKRKVIERAMKMASKGTK